MPAPTTAETATADSAAIDPGRPPGGPAAPDVAASTVVIRPTSGWNLGLRELWDSKSLLYYIAWRDVKIRYKQTVFGAAWAVISRCSSWSPSDRPGPRPLGSLGTTSPIPS